jgi:lipopolysaccharide biosynthesis glycosyltransferase
MKKYNQDKEALPIFFAVDDGYIPFLAVALESLVAHTSKENTYDIKILFTNVKEENQKKIKKYERENITIEFVDLNEYVSKISNKLYVRDYFSQTTYYRLFIPNIYQDLKKILYLDSDIILLDDVAKLYNIDLEDNLVGAIPDGAVQSVPEFQDYVEKVVGLSTYKNYFNAGIMLMNLEALRQYRFEVKFTYLLDTIKFKVAQDQDYLNRLCKGRVKIIDSRWNVMPGASEKNRSKDISLIHFNLSNKPWHLDNIPYQEHFWNFAEKTEFSKQIHEVKNNYSEDQKQFDIETGLRLVSLAAKEADCVGDDRIK